MLLKNDVLHSRCNLLKGLALLLATGLFSLIMADEFAAGAREAGHEVEKVCLYDKTINFCKGCLACQKTQRCVIHDDADAIARKMKDYNGTEKIGDPPRALFTKGAMDGFDPSIGEITLSAPWGNLAIFYRDFPWSRGLIPLGRITSGVEKLAALRGNFEVTFER